MNNTNLKNFNLLAPKSKEEIVSINERDNTVLYSVFLIFFAVIIFAIFTLGKALLIDPRIVFLNESLIRQSAQITSYDQIKKVNGEVFIKSNTLAPIVEQDIKLTQLLEVANKLVENVNGVSIVEYSRELSGLFKLTLTMPSYDEINDISANANEIDILNSFYIESLRTSQDTNGVQSVISFKLSIFDKSEVSI